MAPLAMALNQYVIDGKPGLSIFLGKPEVFVALFQPAPSSLCTRVPTLFPLCSGWLSTSPFRSFGVMSRDLSEVRAASKRDLRKLSREALLSAAFSFGLSSSLSRVGSRGAFACHKSQLGLSPSMFKPKRATLTTIPTSAKRDPSKGPTSRVPAGFATLKR